MKNNAVLSRKRILRWEQVQQLRSACDTNIPGGKRDLAIMDSMLYQGMRLSEVANIKIEHIQSSEDEFFIHINRRPKPIKAHYRWLQSLNDWLDQRGMSLENNRGPIFVQITNFDKSPRKPLGKRTISLLGCTLWKSGRYRTDERSNQAFSIGSTSHVCKECV